MPGLYASSGYNLDRMELTFMWLDAQVEQMNEEAQKKKGAMKILIKPNSSKKHYLLAVDKADLWKEESSGWHFYLIEIEGPKLPALRYDFDSQELKKVLKVWNEAKKASFFDDRYPMRGLISSPTGKQKFPLNDLNEIVVDV